MIFLSSSHTATRVGVTRTRLLRQLMDVLPREMVLGPVLNGAKLAPDMAYYYADDGMRPEDSEAEGGRRRRWGRRKKSALKEVEA